MPKGKYIATPKEASTDKHNINNSYCIYILFNDNNCCNHRVTTSFEISVVAPSIYNQLLQTKEPTNNSFAVAFGS